MSKLEFAVLGNLDHDQVKFEPGDTVTMTEGEAEPLIALGILAGKPLRAIEEEPIVTVPPQTPAAAQPAAARAATPAAGAAKPAKVAKPDKATKPAKAAKPETLARPGDATAADADKSSGETGSDGSA